MVSREKAAEVKKRHSVSLLSLPGVVGVGVKQDDDGQYVLAVHVTTDVEEARATLPEQIEGCKVKVEQSGQYRKL
jgi:hypothetical protein